MSPISTSDDSSLSDGSPARKADAAADAVASPANNPPDVPLVPAVQASPRPWLGFTIDALLAVVLLLVASVLLVVPLVAMEMAVLPSGTSSDDVLQSILPQITVAAIMAMLIAAIATWALRGRAIPGALPCMPLRPALAWALLAGIGIQLAVVGMDALLRSVEAPLTPSNAEPLLALNRQWPWLTWLLVVGVGPFAEELLFRHVLLRRFALAGQAMAGLVATSTLFAVLHEVGQGSDRSLAAWLGILGVYLVMGVGFGWVYLRTGRFWAAFAAHAACNATAMSLAAFST